jgi:hypothetical protein
MSRYYLPPRRTYSPGLRKRLVWSRTTRCRRGLATCVGSYRSGYRFFGARYGVLQGRHEGTAESQGEHQTPSGASGDASGFGSHHQYCSPGHRCGVQTPSHCCRRAVTRFRLFPALRGIHLLMRLFIYVGAMWTSPSTHLPSEYGSAKPIGSVKVGRFRFHLLQTLDSSISVRSRCSGDSSPSVPDIRMASLPRR